MYVSEMSVRMRGFARYTRLDDALRVVLSRTKRLGSEVVAFDRALGRVLAEDVTSKFDVPPFDRSAVDGYAVRAAETFRASEREPIKLRIVGSVAIGLPAKLRVRKGEAVKIMTGSPLPKGADAVVMIEHTSERDKWLEVRTSLTPGKNVSARGEDVRVGEIVIKHGRKLRPQDIGMLVSSGNTRVHVARMPRVAIIATGDELEKPGKLLGPAKIVDINSYSLAAAVTDCGGLPNRLGIVLDKPELLRRVLRKAVKHDAVLVSAGSSVGEHDIVPSVISEMGELLLHGVAIRPGGPTGFGVVRGKPVFALAGFPVASLVAFHMLARPALRAMQGLPADRGFTRVKARLARKVSSTLGRADVVRVKLRSENGEFVAEPIRVTGSSVLSSMTRADGFVIVPEDCEGFDDEEAVEVELYS